MFIFTLRPLYSHKETWHRLDRRLGGPHSLSELSEVEKNFYARIQTPNRQVHSVVTLHNSTAKCMHTVLWGIDPFFTLVVHICPFTGRTTSVGFCLLWCSIHGSPSVCAKTPSWEVTSESGCATVSRCLEAGEAFSAAVLRSSRHVGHVYGAE